MSPDPAPSAAEDALAFPGARAGGGVDGATAPSAAEAADQGAIRAELRGPLLRLGIVAFVAAGAFAFARLVALPSIPMCAFKVWTGRPCPGCGMTRAVVHLATGDLAGSLRFHPLGAVFAAGLVVLGLGAARGLRDGHDPVWRWLLRHGGAVALWTVAALLAVWVVRTFVVPGWASDPIGPSIFSARAAR